ncbi:MAG: SH3 domain-containing protein [Lachnospiraceae bacterium]|nr:SH3 domain-containing protein [Lachnospiraceae bacterium]
MKRRRGTWICAAVIAAGLLSVIPAMPAKASIGTGQITGDNVNVRSGAGTENAQVTTLAKGSQTVIEGVKQDKAGKYWYQISVTVNGKSYSGYVIADYVKYSASEKTAEKTAAADTSATAAQTEDTSKKKSKKKADQSADQVTEIKVPDAIAQNGLVEESANTQSNVAAGDTQQAASSDASKTTTKVTGYAALGSGGTFVKGKKAKVKGSYVRIRKSPVTGQVYASVSDGKKLKLLKEKKGTDGYTWYKVSFKQDGKTVKGYIRSDLVLLPVVTTVTNTDAGQDAQNTSAENAAVSAESAAIAAMTDAQFQEYLKSQGFPKSYQASLIAIHKQHPGWVIKAQQTGLDWTDALTQESRVGLNLVAKSSIASWKSMETAAYNWKKDTWYGFDGGSWAAASKELIAYYLDPRNFLTETQLFQFETLEYRDYQTAAGVKKLLDGSFMKGNFTEPDGTQKSYADTFVAIGKQVGVSPYHLAARCYQEQGLGRSDSISGTVAGLENIFNYFNIGAYASGGNSPTRQGLIYASSTSAGAANYCRPWNTRTQSILGGATYLSERYVKVGQNTLYLQKFNVTNKQNGLYKHQYMANVQAAGSEAVRLSKAGLSESCPVFYIPVYTGMPEQPCAKPTSSANPNNYLISLSIGEKDLTPEFDGATDTYTVTVKKKVERVEIEAVPAAATSQVSGIGEVELERGDNVFEIICTSQAGTQKKYTLTIHRK